MARAAASGASGGTSTPVSDLASLGYVTVELLSGRALFSGAKHLPELIHAKRTLVDRLPELLPEEAVRNELLMTFCRGMIAPDPRGRFPSAEAAELLDDGAAAFQNEITRIPGIAKQRSDPVQSGRFAHAFLVVTQ